MGRHLRDADILQIVELLDGWKDGLTWEALSEASLRVVGMSPTRQTLSRIVRIQDAFALAKARIKSGGGEAGKAPHSIRLAADRIKRLENENARLKQENSALLQQFLVWQYNAHVRGMSQEELDRPLPLVDRAVTVPLEVRKQRAATKQKNRP
ncbi:hypothetical protein [Cupriavidus sp. RAF12]|uniref:hypothetical protein n=1 Tax=Cupriavidus sp. RAF12 TaxID=3233050 RepID=UPI003F93E52A